MGVAECRAACGSYVAVPAEKKGKYVISERPAGSRSRLLLTTTGKRKGYLSHRFSLNPDLRYSHVMSHVDEVQRLEEVAIQLFHDDKILQAARILLQVYQGGSNVEVKSDKHSAIFEQAEACEHLVACFQEEKQADWVGGKAVSSTGTHHGDTAIYYKIVDNGSSEEGKSVNRLQCRLQTPISESLLVPIISVLNESQLYHTWIPSWSFPVKFGVRRVEKIKQVGRCSQIIIGM